jgi:hypothetical protein
LSKGNVIRYLIIRSSLLGLVALGQAWWFVTFLRDVGGSQTYYILVPTFSKSFLLTLHFDMWMPCVDKLPTGLAVSIPFWIPLVLFVAYPAWAFLAKPIRNFHRRRRGLCVNCGYNLAGNTTGICPECGAAK